MFDFDPPKSGLADGAKSFGDLGFEKVIDSYQIAGQVKRSYLPASARQYGRSSDPSIDHVKQGFCGLSF
ncbi:hypothetical protein NF701_02385 [Sphingomonadaceae bacterium OTU29THOMA1]|nr:hypothetical protein NF701_02385 [Sphingomonadaceae bacterium OTU29THOMA1]